MRLRKVMVVGVIGLALAGGGIAPTLAAPKTSSGSGGGKPCRTSCPTTSADTVAPSVSIATPSVIILVRYVRAPRRRAVAVTRRGVLRRDGHRCAYCRAQAATVDHVMPRSRGGADAWENLVACCLRCNSAKGNRTPDEIEKDLPQRRPHESLRRRLG